jgi:TolA-binding protein
MKSAWTLCAVAMLATALVAQTSTAPKSTRKKTATVTAADVQSLKDAIAAQQAALAQQQQQIQQLQDQLHQKDQAVQQAQSVATDATSKADAAQAAATQQQQSVTELKNDLADMKTNNVNTATTMQEMQKTVKTATESPTAIHYKGVALTPGGFIAAETVTRQRGIASSINTPFNSIPYPGNALAHINESDFTARQSRLSLLAEGKAGSAKLTGYWEGDFLGTGVTSNNRQSNSYIFRQRVLYGQAAFDSGWIITGGQQWTLATETRKGITNRTEILPQTIDPQYHVGFNWARQYGFRVVKDFSGKFALGVSVEAPQATIGGRGFSAVTTTDLGKATVSTTGNAFVDAPGNGGGLLNFSDTTGYSFSKSPDIIVKAAADPGWGHYEVFGIFSTFRNRVYPCGVVGTNTKDTVAPTSPATIACGIDGSTSPSSIGAYNDTRYGGGVGANIRVPVVPKKLDFALQGAAGDGIGRYGSAQIADLTLRPDGTQALIRTAHALGEFELHATPKLDFYAYFGGEYGWRTAYSGYDSIAVVKTPGIPATTTTTAIPGTTTTTIKMNQVGGYGSPFANNSGCNTENAPTSQLIPSGGGTCAGDTRLVVQGSLGFWHRLTQGPKGGLRWGIQYSYFERLGWSGSNGTTGPSISPKGVDNMVWTSFRYYLP